MSRRSAAANRPSDSCEPEAAVLRVNPTMCTGVGMCSFAAVGLIDVDSWGYPIMPARLDRTEMRAARSAVSACPRGALILATSLTAEEKSESAVASRR